MKAQSALFLVSIGFVGLVARPACAATVDGLLQARGEEYSDWTPSIKYVPIIRGIEGRQITTSCVTAGWIPCTAYASDRGCRPPGGTCCIDGNYCENGRDCVDIPGQTRGGCCARGTTCAGTSRECKSAGSSLCPEKDYCCAAEYICGHNTNGIGSTCNLNIKSGATTTTRPTTTPRTTTARSTSTSRTPTPTPLAGGTQTLAAPVNAGAIAGGVVGGVVVIALIGLLIFYKRRRSAADAAVLAAAHAQTGPGAGQIAPGGGMAGPGGMGYSTAPGTLQGTPMMENKFGTPPMVAGLSYAGNPEIHNEPGSAYAGYAPQGARQVRPTSYYDANGNPMAFHPYGGLAPDSNRPISIATSLPTSPYVGIGAVGGPAALPGQFPVSPSPGSAYSGIAGAHDPAVGGFVAGRRPNPTAPASPTNRFSTFSENSSIGPALHPVHNTPSSPGSIPSPGLPPGASSPGSGPNGGGGFYYNSAAISPGMPSAALPTGASAGGFNPTLMSRSSGGSGSPTAGRFSTSAVMAAYQQPSTPATPLTGSSEQGLLSNAQAQGMAQGSSSGGGGVRSLPPLPGPDKRQW